MPKRRKLTSKLTNETNNFTKYSDFRVTLYTPKVNEDKKTPPVLQKVCDMNGENVSDEDNNNNKENSRPGERGEEIEDQEEPQIIPWRAQLRKTNSKLSLLD